VKLQEDSLLALSRVGIAHLVGQIHPDRAEPGFLTHLPTGKATQAHERAITRP
jgi:hypothetical protein